MKSYFMKPLVKILGLLLFLLIAALATQPIHAQPNDCEKSVFGCFEVGLPGEDTTTTTTIDSFVQKNNRLVGFIQIVVNIATGLIVAIGLIAVVVAGYVYMTAGGDAGKVGKSKEIIAAALLGITLALASYLILNTISPQFASDLKEPDFGQPPE